jgi:DNA primase
LTEAKDPDEYVTKFGFEALQKKIATAPELFNLVLQMWMAEYKGEASQKVKLIDQVRPVFDSIPDSRLKSLYATELTQRMNVSMDWVRSSLTQTAPVREFQKPQDQAQAQRQEELTMLKQARESWLNQHFSKLILAHLEAKELNLRQEAANLVMIGNPNNDLIRTKIAESMALAKVAALMHGVLEKL